MELKKLMKWVPVESSLFSAAFYRHDRQELYLRFRDGNIYRYFNCPLQVYNDFLTAESKGRYFARIIRNQFRYQHVHRALAVHSNILNRKKAIG